MIGSPVTAARGARNRTPPPDTPSASTSPSNSALPHSALASPEDSPDGRPPPYTAVRRRPPPETDRYTHCHSISTSIARSGCTAI